jgi:hypothetical protein
MYQRILLLFGLLTFSALSQEAVVQTEILTIALDEAVDELYFFDGKSVVPFQANITGLSQPIAYKGPQKLVLRASIAEFTAKPPLPPPVASVDLPLNANRVLLCCLKSQDSPLKIVAYNIASTGSRAGDYRFFNFSSKTLSVILGEKSFALEPKLDKIVSNSAWQEDVLDLPMQVASVENNKPQLVYSSVWGHRPGRRNFIFLFDGQHASKPIGICRFFDIPSPVKKPPAP